MTKVFFDTEFTGLHQATTLVSIGLIAESGETFYAELTDYDKSQCDPWIQQNVIAKLQLQDKISASVSGWESWDSDEQSFGNALEHELAAKDMRNFRCVGNKVMVADRLKRWLAQFDKVQMWSDLLCYDWVLLVALVADYGTGNYPRLPDSLYYIPMDICPLFERAGVDPDISREQYAGGVFLYGLQQKHTALFDAQVIKACYERLVA